MAGVQRERQLRRGCVVQLRCPAGAARLVLAVGCLAVVVINVVTRSAKATAFGLAPSGVVHPAAAPPWPPNAPRAPAGQALRTARLWRASDRVSLACCGLIGARFVFALHGAGAAASVRTILMATGSALLTAFGGGTQSKLLHWAARRAAMSEDVPLPSFAWQRPGPYAFALFGVVAATALHCVGLLSVFEGSPIWAGMCSLNCGLVAGLMVSDSEWFAPLDYETETTPQWLLRVLKVPGAFLFAFGGGLWRDLLGGMAPSALFPGTFAPMFLGVAACLCLRRWGGGSGRADGLVLAAGVPTAACLTAGWMPLTSCFAA